MRALAVALFADCLPAQKFRGALSGSVKDAKGAPIAKAKIAVTETRTGANSDTVSEDSGDFSAHLKANPSSSDYTILPFKMYMFTS